MQILDSETVKKVLKDYRLPILNQDVVSTGWRQDVQIEQASLKLRLQFGFPLLTS